MPPAATSGGGQQLTALPVKKQLGSTITHQLLPCVDSALCIPRQTRQMKVAPVLRASPRQCLSTQQQDETQKQKATTKKQRSGPEPPGHRLQDRMLYHQRPPGAGVLSTLMGDNVVADPPPTALACGSAAVPAVLVFVEEGHSSNSSSSASRQRRRGRSHPRPFLDTCGVRLPFPQPTYLYVVSVT